MKAIGFFTRAIVIELLAIGAIVWFAAGGTSGFENVSPGKLSGPEATRASVAKMDRPTFVQTKLERVASELRSAANQFVDETLAAWFGK